MKKDKLKKASVGLVIGAMLVSSSTIPAYASSVSPIKESNLTLSWNQEQTGFEIQDIKNGTITINKKVYKVASNLNALVNEENKEALIGSKIDFRANSKNVITKILFLKLTTENTQFDGKGLTINGDVTVESSHIAIKNMKINGELLLKHNKDGQHTLSNVSVLSTTYIDGNASASTMISSSRFTTIVSNHQDGKLQLSADTKLLSLYVTRNNTITAGSIPQLFLLNQAKNVSLSGSVTTLILKTNTTIELGSNTTIKTVSAFRDFTLTSNAKDKIGINNTYLYDNVKNVTSHAPISTLTVFTDNNVNLKGSKVPAQLILTGSGTTTLDSFSTTNNVIVKNKKAQLLLKGTIIKNIKLPKQLKVNTVVTNYEEMKSLIEATNGKRFPGPIKSTLKQLILMSASYQESDYTISGWEDFKKALGNAEAVEKNSKATQNEVDAAITALQQAIKGLDKTFSLTIMHTNDTHATLDNIARRATAIETVRKQKPNSLLLDAGDVFSGTLYFNVYEGQADLEFMNMLGYDAMTFGNHEFDKGTKVLADFVKNTNFPMLSANIDFSSNDDLKGYVKDKVNTKKEGGAIYSSMIREINGEKVGVFGLTTEDTAFLSSAGESVKFENVTKKAQATVDQLESQGVNKIIALTHLGYENDIELAKAVDEIDVVVGGHTHTKVDIPTLVKDGDDKTLVVQAQDQSKFLGTLDITFDSKGDIYQQAGNLIDLNERDSTGKYVIQDNPVFAAKLAEKDGPINEIKAKVVGSSVVALDGIRDNVRTRETNLGNLITDAMVTEARKTVPETTIALQNGGGIRAGIDQGDITLGEVLTVMPFANMLVTVKLTGDEIKAALEQSVSGLDKKEGRFLQTSGLRYEYDPSKAIGSRVEKMETLENGKYIPLQANKYYWVATNGFMADGGDGYTMMKQAKSEGRIIEQYVVDYEVFVNYLTANPNISPQIEGRIVARVNPAVLNGTTSEVKTYNNSITVDASTLENIQNIIVKGNLYITGKEEGDLLLENVVVEGDIFFQ
ncbi:MAG: bifunctional metallophosphatase/5'-nucleotidase [Bacillaceae bacterium]